MSAFPLTKQTVIGGLIFVFFLWTLSSFTQTTAAVPTDASKHQPTLRPDSHPKPPPVEHIPQPQLTLPPAAPGPNPTLPPWYNEEPEGDKAGKPVPTLTEPEAKPEATPGSEAHGPTKSGKPKDRPLILYAFAESEAGRDNLKFFVDQGLHDGADFKFIINGESNASSLIPTRENIEVIQRPNTCFDLGAFGEVLRKDDLYKKHKRFITMNASIRGPFLPYWAKSCWSDMYLDRVTEKVKLVGMTGNCWPQFHVQSMIWATDSVGIDLLLNPPPGSSKKDNFGDESDNVGFGGCYDGWNKAVHAEIGTTGIFTGNGYEVDLMMMAYHKSVNYIAECDSSENGDVLWNGKYFGTNVHPYETIFIKANRDLDPALIEHLTEWHLASGHNSYAVCGA